MTSSDSIWHFLVQKDSEIIEALSKHYLSMKDCDFLGNLMADCDPASLDKLADRALSVMTVTNPCKVLIEGLPEDPLCVYAPMYETHTTGIFTVNLPSSIHIGHTHLQNQSLPLYIQLRHAVWLCVYKCEDMVYHARAMLDHSVEQELQHTIPWCPPSVLIQPITYLPHTHTIHTKKDWIDLYATSPTVQKQFYMYPSVEDIQTQCGDGKGHVVGVQGVGLVYVPCEGDKLVVLVDHHPHPTDIESETHIPAQSDLEIRTSLPDKDTVEDGVETVQDDSVTVQASNDGVSHTQTETLAEAHGTSEEEEVVAAVHTPLPVTSIPPSLPADSPITTGALDLGEASSTPAPAAAPIPPTPANSSTYDTEPEHLTPSERREWRKKREENEKKKRLQDFLKVDGSAASSSTPADTNQSNAQPEVEASGGKGMERRRSGGGGSIADRFEQAKKKQQEDEEERLNKIKNDTTRRVTYTKSQYQPSPISPASPSHANASPFPSPSPSSPALTKPTRSMRNLWEDALNTSKTSEETRFQMTKNNTISQFQLTKGTGIVKKRIGEWEELFVQIAATAEQLKEFLLAAQEMASRIEMGKLSLADRQALQLKFQQDCLIPEDFIINQTHVYSSYLLPIPIHGYLKSLLKDATSKYVALQCGVYGDSTHTPPICVYATVIMTHEQKVYVSVTIKSVEGMELIGGEGGVYGVKKIVVKGVGGGNAGEGEVIFEKLVNIIPEAHMIPYIEGYVPYVHAQAHTQSQTQINSNTDSAVDGFEDIKEEDREEEEEGEEVVTQDVEGMLDNMAAAALHTDSVAPSNTITDLPQETPVDTDEGAVAEEVGKEEKELEQGDAEKSGEEVVKPVAEEDELLVKVPEGEAAAVDPSDGVNVVELEDVPKEVDKEVTEADSTNQSAPAEEVDAAETKEKPKRPIIVPPTTPLRRKSSRGSSGGEDEDGPGEGESVWVTLNTPMSKKGAGPEAREGLEDGGIRDILEGREGEFDQGLEGANGGWGMGADEHSDEEGEEGEEIDDMLVEGLDGGEGSGISYNTFGRPLYLPTVTPPRSFAANPVSMLGSGWGVNKHIAHKYSWSGEDECPPLYPPYHQKLGVVYTDITEAHVLSCSAALFTIVSMGIGAKGEGEAEGIPTANTPNSGSSVSDGRTLLFTCSLKHASTDSIYMTEGGKVFDWVRGAAKSGYMGKWPMASQNLGRVRRRFFVLRDNLLSYYRTKPQTEDKLYTRNTLCLNEQTSISIGRKFFTRCLVITTPVDTLWIRMYRDFSSETAMWMHEMNKAIAYQKRQKLFMSMPRIESKWFHEVPSPLFNLVSVDHIVREDESGDGGGGAEGKGYVTVGLFRLAKGMNSESGGISGMDGVGVGEGEDVYSLDVGSSDVQRTQLEVLNDLETPFLPTSLSTVKLYGGMVILGGSQGYVGIGVVAKTKVGEGSGKRALIVFNTHNDPPTPPAFLSGPPVTPPPYPHSVSPQNSITSIAVARGACAGTPPPTIFATADTEGTVAIWSMPRSRFLDTLNPYLALSSSALRNVISKLWPKVIMVARVGFLSAEQGLVFDKPSSVAGTSPAGSKRSDDGGVRSGGERVGERIVKLSFAPGGNVLVVSTTKRLLLLSLAFAAAPTLNPLPTNPLYPSPSLGGGGGGGWGDRSDSITSVDFMHMSGVGVGVGSGAAGGWGLGVGLNRVRVSAPKVVGWGGWVELDRTPPHLRALFDVCFEELKGDADKGEAGSMSMVEWKLGEEEEEVTGEVNTFSSLFGGVRRTSLKANSVRSGLRRCSITRVVWTPEMLTAAMVKQKPVI